MKRVLILLALILFSNLVLAGFDLKNHSIKTDYLPDEKLSGNILIDISDLPIDSVISTNQGDEILLKELLDLNKKDYNCSPSDCSYSYNKGVGAFETTLRIGEEKKYAGFFIKGNNIEITGLNFSLSSDFSKNPSNPLKLNFFEYDEWEFNVFSESYSPIDWGCYSPYSGSAGQIVIKNSNYCEPINFLKSDSYFVGAKVDDSDNKDLKMMLYTEDGHLLGDCNFNPNDAEGCEIEAEEGIFQNGTYKVCVGAESPTNYFIYEESVGRNCGYVLGSVNGSERDYAIFGQSAMYADGKSLWSAIFDFENYVNSANRLIEEKYGGDCSDGCILPIEISGINQSVTFSRIVLDYSKNLEEYVDKNIYSLTISPALIDFAGTLDLSKTNFKIKERGDLILYLDGKKLFEEEVDFLPAPIVTQVSPINPPAGVPVNFYANTDFNGSKDSLKYRWNLNGSIKETTKNFVSFTLDKLASYNLEVQVSYKNLTTKKNYTINPIAPRDAINVSIAQRRRSIDSINSFFNGLPTWYSNSIKQNLNLSSYENTLKKIESQLRNGTNDSTLLGIAKEIYSMNFLSDIYSEDLQLPFSITDLSDIDPEFVAAHLDEQIYTNCLEEYRDSIFGWQNENFDVVTSTKKIILKKESGETVSFIYYNLRLNSIGSPGYLIINKPSNELTFKDSLSSSNSGDNTVIYIENSQNVEYFHIGEEETSFYISPSLSDIITTCNINPNCNFNSVCESGEDYKTCRTDCKPYNLGIVYLILAFILFLVVYTALQMWYKNHYESFLFGDRNQVYNLLMYVANARARGVKDDEIKNALRDQGWSGERIAYIMKKSYGKSVGMIEIIPISRISALMRNSKAKKSANNPNDMPMQAPRETLINDGRFRQL